MAAAKKLVGLANAPEVKAAAKVSTALVKQAKTLTITTGKDYRLAAQFLKNVKKGIKDVDAQRRKITDPINLGLDAANELFRPYRESLLTTEKEIKAAMSLYHRRLEEHRQQEQDAADEAAAVERARIEKLATKARKSGNKAKATDLTFRAAMVVAPVLRIQAPRVEGLSMREQWYFEIIDPMKIKPAFTVPDEEKIGQQIRAVKNADEAVEIIGVGGVRVWSEKIPASAAARDDE